MLTRLLLCQIKASAGHHPDPRTLSYSRSTYYLKLVIDRHTVDVQERIDVQRVLDPG